MIAIAQVSDVHLDGSPERARRARAVMDRLRGGRAPLDAVLVTGDIADHGRPSEYEEARTILSAPCPVLFLPGNHDERDAFRRGLLSDRVAGAGAGRRRRPPGPEAPLNQVHRVAGAVLALCDSVVPGQDGGYLADETLDWLDAVLSDDPGAPALVCLHHYPVPLHTELADTIRLARRGPAGRGDQPASPGGGRLVRACAHRGGHHLRRPALAGRPGRTVHRRDPLGRE